MTLDLVPADTYTVQELTDLYNQTRVDYLVPMPMNADRLNEYIHDFDVDLHYSCVVQTSEGDVLGLSMLGFRNQIGWITRLGVLPNIRRGGAGSALMACMLDGAKNLGAREVHLEVIKNNEPAYQLFLKSGFVETETYHVMRHAPHLTVDKLQGAISWMDYDSAISALEKYPHHITWINAINSMRNSKNTEGLHIKLPDGSSGWLVYRNTKYTLRSTLSHLIMHTESGDPHLVGTQLLSHLHTYYPNHDTYAENIHEADVHLPAFQAMGYFVNFSRIEMRCEI